MSEGTRIPREDALALAGELIALLSPWCERIEAVGSLRRLRPDVGDIELLTIPNMDWEMEWDLFGAAISKTAVNRLDSRCRYLIEQGVFQHRPDKNGRPAFGSKYKRLVYADVGLDLFSVLKPAQWGVLSVIRTGSADYVHRLVTPVEKGGHMPRHLYCRDGSLWTTDGTQVETPEEEQVFAAIGRPYIEPADREV